MERPTPAEHVPYFAQYIALVPEGDVLQFLDEQLADVRAMVAAVPEEHAGHRYAPGKWSIREVLGHLIDVERILAYRAFSIARGETQPLNGFDPEAYAARSGADGVTLLVLLREFETLRQSNLEMLRRLDGEAWLRTGTADGKPVSVRALAYIIAGHVPHHLAILRDRYGISWSAPR